jgi:molybdenum cofactor guanylyltransferase
VTIAGVILAGGRSQRMGGGDKCLRLLAKRPMLAHVIERARGQVVELALNANGDPGRFGGFRLPVVPDSVADFAGPLAGILAGLDWAATAVPSASHVATFAGDAPFLPRDLVSRLASAVADNRHGLACARSAGRAHPVFALWPVALRHALRYAVTEEGIRKVDVWTARYPMAVVDYASAPLDPFFNINRPDDLADAEALLETAARHVDSA